MSVYPLPNSLSISRTVLVDVTHSKQTNSGSQPKPSGAAAASSVAQGAGVYKPPQPPTSLTAHAVVQVTLPSHTPSLYPSVAQPTATATAAKVSGSVFKLTNTGRNTPSMAMLYSIPALAAKPSGIHTAAAAPASALADSDQFPHFATPLPKPVPFGNAPPSNGRSTPAFRAPTPVGHLVLPPLNPKARPAFGTAAAPSAATQTSAVQSASTAAHAITLPVVNSDRAKQLEWWHQKGEKLLLQGEYKSALDAFKMASNLVPSIVPEQVKGMSFGQACELTSEIPNDQLAANFSLVIARMLCELAESHVKGYPGSQKFAPMELFNTQSKLVIPQQLLNSARLAFKKACSQKPGIPPELLSFERASGISAEQLASNCLLVITETLYESVEAFKAGSISLGDTINTRIRAAQQLTAFGFFDLAADQYEKLTRMVLGNCVPPLLPDILMANTLVADIYGHAALFYLRCQEQVDENWIIMSWELSNVALNRVITNTMVLASEKNLLDSEEQKAFQVTRLSTYFLMIQSAMSSGAQDEMREFLDKVKSMGPLPEDWKKLYDQWEAVVNPQQQTATAAVGLPVSSASAGDTKANMA